MLGNNVNVDLYDINAGAAINQVKAAWNRSHCYFVTSELVTSEFEFFKFFFQASKAGIVYACEMAMSVDKREIEKKAEFILTNMCGAYDAALLSPLTFSALVKDLTDQVDSLTTVRSTVVFYKFASLK